MEKNNKRNQRTLGNASLVRDGEVEPKIQLMILIAINIVIIVLIILLFAIEKINANSNANSEPRFIVQKEIEYVDRPLYIEVEKAGKETVKETVEVEEPTYRIDVTQQDIDLMARVVMSESSICDIDAKYAVAVTIVNRVMSDKFPNTVYEVVYQGNQYSTQDNGEPDAECYTVVEWALTYEAFPKDMYYFCSTGYHNFGKAFSKNDKLYFSTEE